MYDLTYFSLMFATAQSLVPFVARSCRRIIAEGERHLAILDHRALDLPACLLRRFERGSQRRPALTHRLFRRLAHGEPLVFGVLAFSSSCHSPASAAVSG